GAMIYLGSAENRLPRMIAAGEVDLHGLLVAVIDAEQTARNPVSDRSINGLELFRLFSGNAGSLVFLDRDGMPLEQLALPQIYHGNDRHVVALFAGYAAGGHYSSMTIADYCRAMGLEDVEQRAHLRMQTNGFGLPLMPGDDLPMVVMPDGQPLPINSNPGVFFVIGYPRHEAFNRQLIEIAQAFRAYEPRIVAVVPHGSALREETRSMVGDLTVAHAGAAVFRSEATPRMLLFGEDGSGMAFYGFQPADVISKHTRVEVVNQQSRAPNMPYGETDTGELPLVDAAQMVQRVERAIQERQ
ncbi:MAG: hypothetical protein ACOCXA_05080, partial [Planctomycetota bacterium]